MLSGTLTSSGQGQALLEIRTPSAVGRYNLHMRLAGQERSYPLVLQDGPLVLAAESSRPGLSVGGEETQLLLHRRTGDPVELLREPLQVELTTTLGYFSDGLQQRTLWMMDGLLTETLTSGTMAGVAEINMNAGGAESTRLCGDAARPYPADARGASPLWGQDGGRAQRPRFDWIWRTGTETRFGATGG